MTTSPNIGKEVELRIEELEYLSSPRGEGMSNAQRIDAFCESSRKTLKLLRTLITLPQGTREMMEEFQKTTPRFTLFKGQLYYREEDVQTFLTHAVQTREREIRDAIALFKSIKGEANPTSCIFCEEIRNRCDHALSLLIPPEEPNQKLS